MGWNCFDCGELLVPLLIDGRVVFMRNERHYCPRCKSVFEVKSGINGGSENATMTCIAVDADIDYYVRAEFEYFDYIANRRGEVEDRTKASRESMRRKK